MSITGSGRRWRNQAVIVALSVAFLLPAACSDPVSSDNGPQDDGNVEFSHPAGFHTQPFALSLSTSMEGGTIYYTLDGSLPDPSRVMDDAQWQNLSIDTRRRTFVYSEPIDLGGATDRPNDIVEIPTTHLTSGEGAWRAPTESVQKAVAVRATAIAGSEASGTDSEVELASTRTYFITSEGRARYSFPVVSLAIDRGSLFADDSGIYVPGASGTNYDGRGEEWERLAHLELFDMAGQRPLAQHVGVRIHGGWTRQFAQKGLRLYSRSDYGTSRFSYRFFPSKETDDFNRLLLRNSGNDWGGTMFRDAAMQTLIQHLPVATQHYQPAILFINGEYWGIHNIRDRLDNHFLETHYGVDRDEVTILEGAGDLVDGEPGDEAAYQTFLGRIRAGELQSLSDYDAHMDVTGYIDYVIVQWYAANNDWPQHNIDFWRYKGPEPTAEEGPRDGRWRWLLYDMDRSFGYFTTQNTNMVEYMLEGVEESWSNELLVAMLEVPEIRHEFLQRNAVHLSTTLHPDRVQSHLAAIADVVEPEIEEHADRWGLPRSVDEWNGLVSGMQTFATARPGIMRSHIASYFDEIPGTAELSVLNLPGTGVLLHSVELSPDTPGVTLSGGQWSGELFTGVPVVLTSTSANLSGATVSGSVQNVEASADSVRFIMTGSAQVTLQN